MKALVLAGGEGLRLRPFTLTTPKSMLPVANIPLLYYQFSLLKRHDINEVVVGIGYKAEYFRQSIGPLARKAGVKAYLSVEDEPLGTGGGLRNACGFFRNADEPLVVVNGDIITDFDLGRILAFHKERNACATIGLVKVSDPSAYGLVITDARMKIGKFVEKPKPEEMVADTINAGVYVFSPGIFDAIGPDNPVSLERFVFPHLLEKGMSLNGYIHCGYWIDIGLMDKYRQANFDILDGKVRFFETLEGGPTCEKKGEGKLLAGRKTVLKEGVRIRGRVIIGENCFIGKDCILEDSIIFSDSVIRDRCVVSGSIIGKGALIENDCVIDSMTLADKSLILCFSRRRG